MLRVLARLGFGLLFMAACAHAQITSDTAHVESFTADTSASDRVGATPGEFRVDEGGAATYSIPIVVAPGSGGFAPTLTLNYSSRGAVGPMGLGWAIGGVSTINRCKKAAEFGDTESYGNPFRPVNFSSTDAYCLDSHRLLPVAATGCPTRSGATFIAEYRTEVDAFRRVCAYSQAGITVGPAYWVVQGKDGSTTEYGVTADSRIFPIRYNNVLPPTEPYWINRTDRVATWAQNRLRDASGNYITFTYTKLIVKGHYDGEFRLTEVAYTGNDVTIQLPYNKVEFEYGATFAGAAERFDFVGGSKYTLASQLTAVVSKALPSHATGTSANVVEIRRYKLGYDTAANGSGYARLRDVQECAPKPTGEACYPKTTFDWYGNVAGLTAYPLTRPSGWESFERAIDSKQGDVNGDGAQDLVWIEDRTGSGSAIDRFKVRISRSSGTSFAAPITPDVRVYRGVVASLGSGYADSLRNKRFGNAWYLYDFNADGHDDLLVAATTAAGAVDQWRVHLATYLGNEWTFAPQASGIATSIPTGFGTNSRLADFTGDGLPDLMVTSGPAADATPLKIYPMKRLGPNPNGLLYGFDTSNVRTVELYKDGAPVSVDLTVNRRRPIDSVDVNGDGRSDLVLPIQASGTNTCSGSPTIDWYVFASEGPQSSTTERFTNFAYLGRVGQAPLTGGLRIEPGKTCDGSNSVQLADINGDSLADLFVRTADKVWKFKANVGPGADGAFAGFVPETIFGDIDIGPDGKADHLQLLDVNGDGRLDVVYPKREAGTTGCGGSSDIFPYKKRLYTFAAWGPESNLLSGPDACLNHYNDPDAVATYFLDIDGAGGPDQFRFGRSGGLLTLFPSRSPVYAADRIQVITNGLGAKTEISYSPITYANVYDRSLLGAAKDWGFGSPVLDVFAPVWAVREVLTSAPTEGTAGSVTSGQDAMASVRYSYADGKMQTGGRGFLGFGRITSTDQQNKIRTTTAYCQNFPFTGRPAWTISTKLDALPDDSVDCNLYPDDPECLIDPCPGGICPSPDGSSLYAPQTPQVTATCDVAAPSTADLQFAISYASNTWAASPAFAGSAGVPVFTYLDDASDRKYRVNESPSNPTLASNPNTRRSHRTDTDYVVDGFGNPTSITITTIDDSVTPETITETKSTTNVYTNTTATGTWQLGRLTRSTITSNRPDNDTLTTDQRTRVVSFHYDATSGVLDEERTQPGTNLTDPVIGADASTFLRTAYTLDSYGNRTAVALCSSHLASRTACVSSTVLTQRPSEATPTWILRRSTTSFDALNRYPMSTTRTFYNPADANGVRNAVAEAVLARNALGDPTQVDDANAVTNYKTYGVFGRNTFSRSEIGAFQMTLYAWCQGAPTRPSDITGVKCPAGAVFRTESSSLSSSTNKSISPTTWAYFDRLGREMLSTSLLFLPSGGTQQYGSVRTTYDLTGRALTVTVPYFTGGPDVADPEAPSAGGTAANQPKAANQYSGLSRSLKQVRPESSSSTVEGTYDAEARKTEATTVRSIAGSTPVTFTTRSWATALGETARLEDPSGFTVAMDYAPFGQLESVKRTPGDGSSMGVEITTRISYDVVGRKTGMTDPDRGVWSYTYNALGEILSQTDSKLQTSRMYYDALGRVWKRTEERAPPGGGANTTESIVVWDYDTADAVNIAGTNFTCEAKGVPPAADSAPSYVLGALAAEADSISQFRREFRYDTTARPLKAHTRIDGSWYTSCQTYDRYGRAKQSFDATGEGVANTYTDGGHLQYVRDGGTITVPTLLGGIYWERRGTDARGNVTVERLADNASLETTRGYEASTGRLLSIQTASAIAGYKYQDLSYTYDFHGNLKSRADKSLYFDVAGMAQANDLKEEFVYDSRDRLTTATRTRRAGAVDTTVLLSQAFDALGNQTSRTSTETVPGFVSGSYQYRTTPAGCTQAGPHALSKVGATTWCYDANGNQTKETSSATDYRDITWTGFDLPEKIVRRAAQIGVEQSTEFRYAPDRSRYKRIDRTIAVPVTGQIFKSSFEDGETDPQGPPATTITVGNVEFYSLGTNTRVRRNIGGFLIVFREGTNAATNQYVLHDGLGSVDAIISTVSGLALLQKPSFDAYGLRRNGDNGTWNALSLSTLLNNLASQVTLRGYTGHEQIDTAALVHMNGRLYDPRVGRFVQGDPVVDDPGDPQAYNRYAYVGNNPLSAVDPSGYSRPGARSVGVAIFSIIVFSTLGPLAAPLAATWGMPTVVWVGFQGALVGAVAAGNAQGALWGAVSGVVFHGIGEAFPGVAKGTSFAEAVQSGAYWSKIAAHAAAGGTLNALNDGNFGHAFISAGVTEAANPAIDTIADGAPEGRSLRILASAMVGGTVSQLVGGNFGNGAITGAFQRAFNGEGDHCNDACQEEQSYRDNEQTRLRLALSATKDGAEVAGVVVEEGYWAAVTGALGRLVGLGRTASQARALGRALEASGVVRPIGAAAHHIVASGARDAARSRVLLEKFGIGINDAANGIFLATGRHQGMHTRAYYEAVNANLAQATTRTEALEVLARIRQGLAVGTFP